MAYRLQEQDRKNRKKRMRRMQWYFTGMTIVVFLLILYIAFRLLFLIAATIEFSNSNHGEQVIEDSVVEKREENPILDENGEEYAQQDVLKRLEVFAKEYNLSMDEYPDEMLELLEKNPETEEFVFKYPLKKDTYKTSGATEALNHDEIPLFLQWDSRWGYYIYGGQPMGLTGCGPTCLSMVALHLLQNPQMTPVYVADFAERNGFYVEGTGTAWALMTQGAAELGLRAQEVPLDEERVMRHLMQGEPMICAMGPGDFTEYGHFIVFAGIKDGKIVVNDPNSKVRSEQLWSFEDIKYQIKNMWAYTI